MANSKPILTGLATPVTFLENTVNAAPQIIDADVTFTDVDNNFDGGTLTVTGLLAEDSVAIRNQGTGAGQIGISGGNVTFGGTVIGSFTGGAGSTFSVTFNASATAAGIEALIENLTYANSSNTPTASRTLELRVADADGAAAIGAIAFTQQTGAANPFNGVDVGNFSTPSFADLDADGDLDAVVGGLDGTLHYFRNTGTIIAPAFTEQTGAANPFDGVDVGGYSSPSFADLDADGDLDAVVGGFDGTLHYFKNDGSAVAPAFAEQTGAANPFDGVDLGAYSFPSFADLDDDGDLDAIVGQSDATLHYYKNTGSAVAPVFAEQTGVANPFNGLDVGTYSFPSFADLDDDGDLDAVVGEHDGTLHYFQNTGSAIAPAFTEQAGDANPFDGVYVGIDSAPSLADLDGDGDFDAVVGENLGRLYYFRNTTPHQPTPQFTQQTGTANPLNGIDVDGYSAPSLSDLDGDGDFDVIVGTNGGNLFYFKNTGSAVAPVFTQQTGAANPVNGVNVGGLSTPSFADLDGDGDLDSIVGASNGTLHYFENTGSATAPVFTQQTGAANPVNGVNVGALSTPSFADLDGDGDLDAVVGNDDGVLRYFKNTGTANAPIFAEQTGAANPFNGIDVGVYSAPTFADFDGDGDLDAVAGERNGTLLNYENTGTTVAPVFTQRTGTANPFNGVDVGRFSTPSFADLDGDGDPDLIVGGNDGTLFYFKNTGAGFTLVVNVTAENDAPTITSNGGKATAAISIAENSTAVTTVTATDPEPGSTLNYTIVPGGDGALFSIGLTSGALAFKTAPNFEAPTDGGANNVYDVTVQVSDGAGGIDTQVIAVTVTNVNVAPVITSGSAATAAENAATTVVVYDAAATDDGEDSGSLTFALSAGGDNDLFKIDATTGEVTFRTSPDFEAPADAGGNNIYDIVVRAGDGLHTATKTVAITVTNLNAAPLITSGSAATAAENAATTVVVYDAAATDDGEDSGSLTFALSAGGDNDLFKIDATTGEVTFRTSPDFEAPADTGGNNIYDIVIRASDGLHTATKAVAITVTNVNAAPVIESGPTATAAENAATTVVVYDAAATDDGEDSGSLTFALSAGGDNDLFKIDATTGEVTFKASPDFEAPADTGGDNVYDIVVRAGDGLHTATKAVAITVTNLNAAPLITSGSAATAAENVATSVVVYDAAATDDGEDSGNLTFSLSPGGDNDLFDIDAATGEVTFRTSPDFEAPADTGGNNIYNIVVRASDGVLITTKAVAITVTNVNAAPLITSGSAATVAENVSTSAVVYDAAAQDDGEDSGTVTFSLSPGGDNDLFDIDAATGEVIFKTSPDFEAPADAGGNNIYDIVVRASDGVLAATKAVAITVTNLNAAPAITSGSAATVAENAATSATVYDAAATDDGEDSGSLTFALSADGDNDLFDIDAATGEVTFRTSPDFEAPADTGGDNVYDIVVRAGDGLHTATKAVAITVTNLNAAPLITSGSAATAAENVATSVVVYDAAATDDGEDSGNLTFSLSPGGDNDLFDIDAATGEVTFRTSPDFEAPADTGGNNIYNIVVRASDGVLITTKAVAITVTNVNAAPLITSGSAATVAENVSTSAVVYDAAAQDDGEDSGTVTFSLSPGGDNDLFDIDAATGEVIFKTSPDFEAPADAGGNNIYDIVVRASDGVLAATKAVAITVTNLNAAPLITSGSAATVVENAATSATVYDAAATDDGEDSGSLTFALSAGGDNDLFDIDAATGEVTFRTSPDFEAPADTGGDNVYDLVVLASDGLYTTTKAVAITVTNLNAAPVITSGSAATVAENAAASVVVYDAAATDDGEDSGSLTFSLSPGGDNDLFDIDAATGEVTFKTSPDFEAPADAGGDNVYDIVVRASDGLYTATKAVAITVTNLNAAPAIVSGSAATVAENVAASATVYDAAAQDDGEDSGTVTFSLSPGGDNDLFDIDAATGEVTFRTSPDFEAPGDIGGNNVYDIVVRASDGVLVTTKAVAITVTNVNAAPAIVSGSTATTAENVATSATVYDAAATDDGEDSGSLTFALSAGGDNDLFDIDATTGEVTFKASPDYEAPADAGSNNVYDLVVLASDGLRTAMRSVSITVTNVNAAPVIVSGPTATVAENVSVAAEAYKVSVTDDGESGSAVTFSLGGGVDDSRFNMDPLTGAVTFKVSPDYEVSHDTGSDNVYDIVVLASDGLLSAIRSVSITVTNVDAPPIFTSGRTVTVEENVSTSTEIYRASVTNVGESGGAVTFSLVGEVDDSRFDMDPTTGAVTFKASPDYEAPSDAGADNVYDLVVLASNGLHMATRSVSITVTNVNAAPVFTSGSTATVAENVSTSTEVYRASVADDGESGSAVTFSLIGEVDDSRFEIDPMTGVVTFKASPDYEARSDAGSNNVYDLIVLASDGLKTAMQSVSIAVTNINAAPVIVSGSTAAVAENVSTSAEVYKASVTDDGESGSTVTFSFGGGIDDSRFDMNPLTGAVTFKASPDHEAPSDTGADNVYDIVVLASDGLLTATRSVAITVTNVDTAPVIVPGPTATVAENVSTSTEVYKVSVTDDGESGGAITFSLGGGADDSRFTMDPTTGTVTFKASPDYEAPSDTGADNTYDIVVVASDGLEAATRLVAITVTNVNAPPMITSVSTATVTENVSTSTEIYKASATDDGESGSAVTFSLGGGADDSRFNMDPLTGAVTFKASPDYEAPADAGADNVYDIVVLASDGLSTTMRSVAISVTNVNAAPVITSGSTATVAENLSTSTEVYEASVTDDGESGNAVTFSLGGGADDNRFIIGATTGGVTFKASPDYEAPADAGADNVYDIVVLASDGLSTTMRSVSISVTSINAAPMITSGATATVAENVSTSTEVYKASATDDGESGSAVAYSLGGGADDGRFTIDPTTGAVFFKASPDYEAPTDAGANNVYDIVVQASDGLSTAARSVSITVSNVVEATNAVDDAYVLLRGSTLTAGPDATLLLNDDVGGPVPTAVTAGPGHGTLQLATDGSFFYVPDAGFSGIDRFEYGIVDGAGIGHVAEALIYVTPVDVGVATTLDLSTLTAEEQVAATYVAFLGRAPDAGGFSFWVDQFNDGPPSPGPSLLLADIASSFGTSDEAKALHPFLANPFDAGLVVDFVESVYDNLFNRSSDAGGLAYWTGQIQQALASGRFVGSVLVDIIGGAQATVASKDITTLMGKVAVSLAFVHEQQESNMEWAGASDVAAARQLLDAVSGDPASVLMGVKNAGELVELHP